MLSLTGSALAVASGAEWEGEKKFLYHDSIKNLWGHFFFLPGAKTRKTFY